MTEIISVRFKSGGKEYFFNPNGLKVAEGQYVILETTNGLECAICSKGNTMIDEMQLISPLRPVLRIATETDLRQQEENKKKEAWAFQVCQEKIAQHKLEMKLIEVEYSFDGSKILFFFTAEGRVDFRALVKDLAGIFRTRIELRQVGSCVRWASGTRRKCWEAWASAADPTAAPPSSATSTPCPSRWPRPRISPSTPPRSPAPAAGSCAV